MKVVFLDRDGVINSNANHYYVYKENDFELNAGVLKSLKQMIKNGYALIIISNQGGISKKIYNKQDLEKLNNYMLEIFAKANIQITETYYCPHHSDIEKCICRKPDSLLLEKAVARFNVDIESSVMIGDSDRDVLAAEKIGIKGLKVKANADLFDEIAKSKFAFLIA
ncbi:MAG: HAD-IIIA family hydrolase [Bacteroidales bacterium]|nr:HAD-IIIA family hydrolase [Bacteroidales bacterium]